MSDNDSIEQEPEAAFDVLVIGGGLAGSMAAIAAAEAGARVALAVKGRLGDSGSSAKAAGIIAAPLGGVDVEGRPIDDTPELHASDTLRIGCELNSPALVQVLAEEAGAGVAGLRRIGVRFSEDEAGALVQLQAPGNSQPRACSVLGGGKALIATLRAHIEALGITLLQDTRAVSLLTAKGRVAGAVLAQERADTPPAMLRAGATVLASGGATGLFPTLSGDPRNAGEAMMLGFDAGAELANLEFVEFTLIYRVRGKVLRIAGLAPFLSRGARISDSSGEDILARFHPGVPPAQVGRAEVVRAVIRAMGEGGGPVRLDCRHFSDAVWEEFEATQGETVLAPIRAAGGEPRTDPIDVLPAAHSMLAGLVIDEHARTTAPGLLAAGECATGVHGAARLSGNGLGGCLVFGLRAGREAARIAADIDDTDVELDAIEGSPAPENLPQGEALEALRVRIHATADGALSLLRDAESLEKGRAEFASITAQLTGAERGEARDLLILSRLGALISEAALRRRESRGLHFRADYPRADDAWRLWQTAVRGGAGGVDWGSRAP